MTDLTRLQYAWADCQFRSKTSRPENLEHFAAPVSDLTTMEATGALVPLPTGPPRGCSHCSTHSEQLETSDIEVKHFMQ